MHTVIQQPGQQHTTRRVRRHLVVTVGGRQQEIREIPEDVNGQILVGRDRAKVGSDGVIIGDLMVSGKHLSITWHLSEVIVTDLGSTNGTCVNDNDQRITGPTALKIDDRITLGSSAEIKICAASDVVE